MKILAGGGRSLKLKRICLVFAVLFGMCALLAGCGSSDEDTSSGTVWFSGAETSEATSAKNGDFFLDTDDGNVYRYVSGSWVYIMCLKGADGESGTDGADGENAYIHIVYSAYETGTNGGTASFSSSWSSGCNYLGIYSGNSQSAPTDASAYTWILISYESSSETPSTVTTYTITYVLNGGTNSSSNPSTYTSSSSTITLASPTYDGYTFGGWYSDASFTNRVTTITSSTGSITLYAKWTETSSGTVYVDVTSYFAATWEEKVGLMYNSGSRGSSDNFKNGTCDVSEYVGCYLTITMPVYTTTSGGSCPYGLVFYSASTVSADYFITGYQITKETVPSGYSSITAVEDRSTTRTVETITVQIPTGAVLVGTTYYNDSFTGYTYSGSFSAVISSEA